MNDRGKDSSWQQLDAYGRKPQDAYTLMLQPGVSTPILFCPFLVDRPIYLHAELCERAVEVQHVWIDRMLPPEM